MWIVYLILWLPTCISIGLQYEITQLQHPLITIAVRKAVHSHTASLTCDQLFLMSANFLWFFLYQKCDVMQNSRLSGPVVCSLYVRQTRRWPLFSPNSNDTGIFVSDIIKGGVTDLDGRLTLGDQILSINGEDIRAESQDLAERLLQVRQDFNLHARLPLCQNPTFCLIHVTELQWCFSPGGGSF